MLQTYKILTGKDKVKKESWFAMASDGGCHTRMAADPLNLRIPAGRLEIRRNFYSQRVPELWNKVPSSLKQAKTEKEFRNGYRKYRREMVAATTP